MPEFVYIRQLGRVCPQIWYEAATVAESRRPDPKKSPVIIRYPISDDDAALGIDVLKNRFPAPVFLDQPKISLSREIATT